MPKIEKNLLKVKGTDGQWHYVPAIGGGSGGGADITITDTAEVGEVLTVEEVDSDGKPTKWKTEKISGGGVSLTYDDSTGELTITNSGSGSSVTYNDSTGELLIA